MSKKEVKLKELEHKIFTLLAMGVSGRGDADRDIPIIKKLATEYEELRLQKEL